MTVTAQPDPMASPLGGQQTSVSNIEPCVTYTDLREWIEEARRLGEVRHVKGLSWQEDIGMAAEVILHDENAPCVIFEDIPGALPGSRLCVNFFGGQRQRMTLGFPADMSKLDLSEAFRAHYMADLKHIPPKFVTDGPVLENVMQGDDVDVTKFLTPKWHENDGGRYIGTGSFNVTRDPDEGWVNCGTYRVMIHDEKSVGFYISPGKHGRIQRDKYQARNEPMPVAIVVGCDPMSFLMASSEVPYGVCEYDVIGGIRGKPVEVIEGPVTGLPFPANAEIVIEGFVQPGNVRPEGPFGEWMGYYASDVRNEPVMDIKAIYYRNDPILLGCAPQRPPDEIARYRAVTRSALLRDNVTKAGVPDVTAAWAHEIGTARLLLAVAIKQRYPGHAKQAGHIASMCHVGAYAGRYVIVVDDDIDVSNLEEVIWAMLTRSDPATSIDIITNAWSTPLDPRIEPERRAKGDFTNSRAIIDACRPWHWRDKFPKVNAPPPEIRRLARQRFGYLLK
ncbi:MAG TPA: UbiD family decarboxylase [Xanthobacteraceae bacterium]|nr:UbiD family decarboxylase [Xanthobacteraceae bacterium]